MVFVRSEEVEKTTKETSSTGQLRLTGKDKIREQEMTRTVRNTDTIFEFP